jgi:hypothetical protein
VAENPVTGGPELTSSLFSAGSKKYVARSSTPDCVVNQARPEFEKKPKETTKAPTGDIALVD